MGRRIKNCHVTGNPEGVGITIVFGNWFETVGRKANHAGKIADGDAEELREGSLAIADDDKIFDGVGIVGVVDFVVEIENEEAVLVQLGHAHPFVTAFENVAGGPDDFDEDVEGNGEVEIVDLNGEGFDLGDAWGGGAEGVEFWVEKHGKNGE